MQFKLPSFWSGQFARIAFCAVCAAAFGAVARAEIRVSPYNGGSLGEQNNGGKTFYYFVQDSASSTSSPTPSPYAFMKSGVTVLDVAKSMSSTSDPDRTYMFEVQVTATDALNLTGTQRAVITGVAMPDSGTAHPIPIAAVDGVSCANNDGNGNCMAKNQILDSGNTTTDHHFAALYPGPNATVRVGFYLNDICRDAQRVGVAVTGCTTTAGAAQFDPPTAATPKTLQLKFNIAVVPSPGPSVTPTGNPLVTMTNAVTFSTQTDTPTFRCNTNLADTYFPGDTEILFYPSGKTPGSGSFEIETPSTADAPAHSIIFVAKRGNGNPDLSSSYATANDVIGIANFGVLTRIGKATDPSGRGFVNSKSDSPDDLIPYTASFIIRDAAGVHVIPSSVPDCKLSPVYASALGGFVSSSNCFIATAAFGSPKAGAVLLFRKFRDEVLLHTTVGTAFVRWYYSWSPAAAAWLEDHQALRVPVLWAFIPLQVIAWLCVHWGVMLVLMHLGFILILLSSRRTPWRA